MAGSVEVGSGYLTLVASAKGIGKDIVGQIAPDMQQAGKDAGKTLAKGITSSAEQGLRSSADQLANAVAASQAKVESASRSLTLQRNKEADAAGKLRVEEAKLQALKDSGKATDVQMVAQAEKVVKAQRDLEVQSQQTKSAIKELTTATDHAAKSHKDLGQASGNAAPQLQAAEGGTKGLSKGMGALSLAAGGALAAVTAAAAGIGAAISSAIDNQTSKAKLTAKLGLDPSESKRLGAIAGKTYAGAYGESLDEVNTAIVRITQDIGKGSDEWTQKTAANVLSVADTFDEDLGGVTRAVGNLIRNGLAKDAQEGLDIVTKGLQNGSNKADDLLDTFNEYSTMFRDIGLTGKQSLGLISQGLKAGARDADTVADALKEFAIRAQDGSTVSAQGFEKIGLNAKEMTKIFAEGGPKAATALDDVLDRLRNMEDPVARNAAAVALFGTKAEDLGDALFSLDPSQAVSALGQVDGATQQVNDTMSDTAASKIESWKRTIQQNVVNFLGNEVIPFLENLAKKIDLSAIVESAKEIFGRFKVFLQGVIQDIRDWAATHKEEIQRFLTAAGEAFTAAKEWVITFIDTLKWLWDTFGEDILTTVINHFTGVLEFLKGVFEIIQGIFQTVKGLLTGDWSLLWEGLKNIASGVGSAIMGIIDMMIGNIVTMLGGDWEQIKSDAKAAWDTFVQILRDHATMVLDAVKFIGEVPGRVKGWFEDMLRNIMDVAGRVIEFVKSIPGRIIQGLGDMGHLLWDVAGQMWDGFIGGMKAKIGEIVQTAKDIAKAPINAVRAVLDSHSPSRVFISIGKDVGAGFVIGMNSTQEAVNLAGNNLAAASIPGLGQVSTGSSGEVVTPSGGSGPVVINVYGAEGQSVESLAEAVANKQRILGRI